MEPVHKSNVLGISSQALCENPGYILASSPAFEIIPLWHSVGIVSFHLRKTMERENHLVHRLVIRKHLRQAAKTGPRLNIPKPSVSTAWSQLNRWQLPTCQQRKLVGDTGVAGPRSTQ